MKLPSLTGAVALVAYIATIPAANLAVSHFGAVPVGFGFVAPAGVYFVGLALVLRDLAREATGRGAVLAAIGIGTVVSYVLSDPMLATASAAAFILAEMLDFAVYEPLRKRGLIIAVVGSNIVGLIADSVVFLQLAFGSLEYFPGQALGKAYMTAFAVVVLLLLRNRGVYRTTTAS
ncbi:VUT family protein [Actinosynnema pretiosum]|uniref:Beta-carotene 15,15'-monooxygenase n=1 Tax=Actinosynnema pretiosum TaxID=42197 RepID=A0A290Z109_9PSEU|nr:VUT family protein [Actinosynnema pretiosum]ATE52682.1 beta-carotene 15,15'-monooxygenase [Actinosynnema pretiosum]